MEVDELRNNIIQKQRSVFSFAAGTAVDEGTCSDNGGLPGRLSAYCDKAEDGSATGLVSDIVPDLFDALSGDYDPEIIYRCFDDQQEMLDCLKNGEVDFVMPVSDGKWYAEQEEFVQSSAVVALR